MPLGRGQRHGFFFPHFGFGRIGWTWSRAEDARGKCGKDVINPAPGRTRANSVGRECPQAFHAVRALGKLTRAKILGKDGALLMRPASADRPAPLLLKKIHVQVAAAVPQPTPVGLSAQGADEPQEAAGVRENPNGVRPPLDLLIQTLKHVCRTSPRPNCKGSAATTATSTATLPSPRAPPRRSDDRRSNEAP